MRVIISAGGTGGHIYPALAIIKKIQEKDKNSEILYIGTHNRMESEIIPQNNIPYKAIEIYGLSKNILKDFKNVYLLFKSYNKCLKIMAEFKPDIVIGVGGYVTMPVIMAAKKLKIKSVIHEQNLIPGKTNKFLSRGVNEVFISFKESINYFAKSVKCVYTSHPVVDNIKNLKPIKKESLGLTKSKKLLLVTSGSLGSSSMNNKLIDFLKSLSTSSFEVLFITGKSNYQEFTKNKFSKNIKVIPYLDNLAGILKSCDLVIGRSGAGMVFELLASSTPSILIPSPNVANNHQYYNAKNLADQKLAIMIEEDNLDSLKLTKLVKKLMANSKEYTEMVNNLSKVKVESSSEIIYQEIKELVDNG